MNVRLAYGHDVVPVDIPDNWINGRMYKSRPIEACADAHAELMATLDQLPGANRLEEIAAGKKSCVIAVDPQYPVVLRKLLPALVEQVEDQTHLRAGDITILVANRLWDPFSMEEIHALLDPGTRDGYRIVLHNPSDPTGVLELGMSSRGIPITVNREYTEGELRLVLGAVAPDLLLGFTGGRAVLAPGLAGRSTLNQLYHPTIIAQPSVRYGNFRDNPFHVHGMETTQKAGCDLCVSAVLTHEGDIAKVFAGHFGQSHFQAMTVVRDQLQVPVKEPMDIVVTSAGGAPHDATLLGLLNTLSAVVPVLKPDGTIVVVADLGAGAGSAEFAKLVRSAPNYANFIKKLNRNTQIVPGQWAAQLLHKILSEHEVIVYSKGMAEDDLWSFGLTPARDINDAIHGAMESHGQRCKIVGLPDGAKTLPNLAAATSGPGTAPVPPVPGRA